MSTTIDSPQFRRQLAEAFGDRINSTDGTNAIIEHGFRQLLLWLMDEEQTEAVLEVGGGRRPLFNAAEIAESGSFYTVNDIAAEELALAPYWVSTLTGNISDPRIADADRAEHFDLIFSRWVFEHVADPQTAYANVLRMLAPGGICINMMPTMFASPFVINQLLPEQVSGAILRHFFPHRSDDNSPKFVAYYRWCRANQATRAKLLRTGFAAAEVIPLYGHGYYKSIAGLRELQQAWMRNAARRNWHHTSSYAVIIVQKP